MKKTKTYTLFLLLSTIVASCTQDFVDINTNPNESTVASAHNMLAPTIVSVVNANLNRNFRVNNEFMQVTVTGSDSRELHRYEVRPSEADYMWRNWYVQLTNIRNIYSSAEGAQQAGFQTFQGISLLLDAWVSSLLTDTYGNVPYFEANRGAEFVTTPAFDHQRDIYADLFSKFERADSLLAINAALPTNQAHADPIFQGDATKWRKFGNSLYLRLLLRIAETNELDAKNKIKEIVEGSASNEYPLMASNDDSAVLRFTGTIPFVTEFFNWRPFDFNGNAGLSEFFINNLLDLQDPRLPLWAQQATLGVYGGMQSAYRQGAVPDIQSRWLNTIQNEPRMGNIMNYAELQFILAEAVLRGYTTGDPKAFYDQGVKSSIEFWGIAFNPAYLNNPAADFSQASTPEEQLKKIHLQKYFALLFTDFQQWFEYRRTEALDLYSGPGLVNNGQMPARFMYPVITRSLNSVEYNAAVAEMGGRDDINNRVWWQRN